MGMFKPSDEAQTILSSMLMFPENWSIEEYSLWHRPTKTKIWIASGPGHITINGYSPGICDRYRIWKALKQLRRNRANVCWREIDE